MDYSSLIMGRAANIAQRAFFDTKEMHIEPHYVFTESEFRQFVQYLTAEQRIICANAASDVMPHSEAHLAVDIVQSCETPEIF